MSERVDLQEFVGAFVAEADELVALAGALLLEIEVANDSATTKPRAVRDLFRALHTIKGLAGMIGVEPIVEIAHELETLLRNADRAGGVLRRAAVDVCLQGVSAIAARVRAVAEQREPETAPALLIDAIAAVGAGTDPAPPMAPIAPEWSSKLGPSELAQLSAALHGGHRAWTVTFAPSEANAANGITITTVRAQLSALGDILKVQPRAGRDAGVTFDILMVSDAPATSLADAAATTLDAVVAIELPAAPAETAPVATAGEPASPHDYDGPAAIGRSLVRVDLARLDELQELLSQMIVSRFKLQHELAAHAESGHDVRRLREVADLQGRQLRDLRRAILRARMVRAAEVLEPLPLLVRSLARTAQKEVKLELETHDVELDKAVADRLLPALVHLVRNAVDHAIELPTVRVAKGKPSEGTVRVSCVGVGGNRVRLVVSDDGSGIDRAVVAQRSNRPVDDDRELLAVLTTPGFSTRTVATRTSGRGLGMDIVKRIAVETLGGEMTLATTPDVGTAFTLTVPLTISVVEVFSFECGEHSFVVPVSSIEEIFELSENQAVQPPASASHPLPVRMLERRGHAVPVLALGSVLDIGSGSGARKALLVTRDGERIAFAVDRMLGRHEVVVRPVDDPLVKVPGIAGSTDLGTGRPTLVLDLGALMLRGHERAV